MVLWYINPSLVLRLVPYGDMITFFCWRHVTIYMRDWNHNPQSIGFPHKLMLGVTSINHKPFMMSTGKYRVLEMKSKSLIEVLRFQERCSGIQFNYTYM